jgi:hypothetical protein
MAIDGRGAGLDQVQGEDVETIDGQAVAGCVRVEFERTIEMDSLELVAKRVGSACATGTPCQDNYCTEGGVLGIFYGTREGEYHVRGTFRLPDTEYTAYRVGFGRSAKYIVLCRMAYGAARGDIRVDSLAACVQ